MDTATALGLGFALIVVIVLSFVIIIKGNNASHAMNTDRLMTEIGELEAELERYKKSQNTAQRAVIKGQLAEQMFPLLQYAIGGYELSDMMFIGKLFDYLIIDGYTQAKDNGGDIKKIVFVEIKSGNAQLSMHQKKFKKAVEDCRVEWRTVIINNDGELQ